jgi:hypothetical protein
MGEPRHRASEKQLASSAHLKARPGAEARDLLDRGAKKSLFPFSHKNAILPRSVFYARVPRAAGFAARALRDQPQDDFPAIRAKKPLAGQSSRQWHPANDWDPGGARFPSPGTGRHSASHGCEPVVSGPPRCRKAPGRGRHSSQTCVAPLRGSNAIVNSGLVSHRLTPVARGVPLLRS